jgi:hypothetical protein
MRKNLPTKIVPGATYPSCEINVVHPTTSQTDSALPEPVQFRAERDSLLWILRIVRREVNWSDDSPTLHMINAALARS